MVRLVVPNCQIRRMHRMFEFLKVCYFPSRYIGDDERSAHAVLRNRVKSLESELVRNPKILGAK